MAKRSIVSEDDNTEINLSSMIDCIFILLIFFIVTTVFVDDTGMQVNKPDAAAVTPLDDKESLAFEITAENKILWSGNEVSLGQVTGHVRSEASDPEVPVVIRVNEKASHGTFVAVWDAAKQGGTQSLSFSTVQ